MDPVTPEQFARAEVLRLASTQTDVEMYGRVLLGAHLPAGIDPTGFFERIDDLNRRCPSMARVTWWYVSGLVRLWARRAWSDLQCAPKTGDWWRWLRAIPVGYSLFLMAIRATLPFRPNLRHLGRVLQYVS